ncbi:class I adenylate-forming enzyme family protein [Lentzea albidocapillata]|uniref:Long-chain acyl-CoA synthetase n=1 Tax=Lentzea albidocapillata TaxID=40571 RepID=A0A1W2BF95_9PSEU|nr:class I adenylate-forming enzyme family protein [Lentzea albidocapillata]SMC71609.1 long-chain acyl-CoA synthetase [Lentzea albidocapillata]
MNVLTSLRRVAERQPAKVALSHRGAVLTYAELFDQGARFGAFLRSEGVEPGQRVGIYMHNQPEWMIALLGIWQAGAVAVPFNYLFHPSALRHAAVDSDALWIVTPATDVEKLRDTLDGLAVTERIISVGRAEGAALSFEDTVATAPAATIVPRMDDDDALLMYTSGSTGQPKGVRQTHRNTTAVCEATIDTWSLTPDDHALVCTPLFHVGGLQLLTLPLLLAGGSVTLRRWQVEEWLDDVVALRPTVLALVPAMMFDIVNSLGDGQMSLDSVRVCAIGGSALPQAKLRALTTATGIVAVNIYGQTEQSGLSITEPLDRPRREGSLGTPLQQIVQTRVVLEGQERDAEHGEVGELWVRGDAVTPGYWQLPEVNATRITSDGWFRTSDLVSVDSDGYFYFVDRADDMIISGGENVYPQMVEGHLATCPLIREVAVIGTAHERFGQQVTAIVVPRDATVTAEDIAAYCEGDANLRGLQRPRRIEIVDAIPRTATNKIDRPTLKKAYR